MLKYYGSPKDMHATANDFINMAIVNKLKIQKMYNHFLFVFPKNKTTSTKYRGLVSLYDLSPKVVLKLGAYLYILEHEEKPNPSVLKTEPELLFNQRNVIK